MKTFISYSHKDEDYLNKLHTHLATLRREGLITEWTDKEIKAGGNLDSEISKALKESGLFIALVSPDYLASNYCYEKEFEYALTKQDEGKLVIVPIIVEDCDWHNTPFSKLKALPKDGKPIANWSNPNTAYLNIIQELRKIISEPKPIQSGNGATAKEKVIPSRNYKIKRDFDSLEKMEEVDKAFQELKDKTIANIREIKELDNIKAEVLKNEDSYFEAIVVNRNKTGSEEARLSITTQNDGGSNAVFHNRSDFAIEFQIKKDGYQKSSQVFNLNFDDYNMYWQDSHNLTFGSPDTITVSKMADKIWKEWLNCVGIEF